jgi:hypothetical protein
MRVSRALLASTIGIAMAAVVAAQDELPQWPQRVIDFTVEEQPLELEGFSGQPGQAWPRYAASFAIESDRTITMFRDRRQIGSRVDDWLLQSPSAERLSEEQRALVRSADVVVGTSEDPRDRSHRLSKDELGIRLYAVTEDDARGMTHAVIEWFERHHRKEFQRHRDILVGSRARLAKQRRQLEEFLRQNPDPAGAVTKAKKAVWYQSVEEAQEDLRALEKAMRAVDVDIAGVTAKRSSIRKYLRDSAAVKRPGVEDMLHQLLIQQDIEMAGAAARRAALESHVQRAREYVQNVEVEAEHRRLTSRVGSTEAYIDDLKNKLRSPAEGFGHTNLLGAVTIQPIRYPGE